MNKSLAKISVPVGVVAIVMLLVVPVPAPLLDVLIIVNILLAVVVLLTTMFVQKPLDFSVFPSLLLVATLLRLGLNVASTRLVLGDGYAGQVIEVFGTVAVGGSIIIGAVIFLILVVIQFVVVTKGAERVAEVGARFTLDAMPGKQMAIDADLNAGLITDVQAKTRRAEVAAEADFYGAMDGASKFVKGDAIAGIIIILINIIGGIAIGILQRGMEIGDALSTYTVMTIGDGLVSQIPALLMAVATGMIVTRSNAESDMGSTAATQLAQSRGALMIAGFTAIALGFIPGMPVIPFLLIGGALIFASWRVKVTARMDAAPRAETTEDIIEQMRVHAVEIALSPDLIDLVTGASDDLLARVKALRRKIAMDMGFVVPPVRTRDSVELPSSTYSIRIAGIEAGRGIAPPGKVLALGDNLDSLPGVSTVEPVFGLVGKWMPGEMRRNAEIAGATVIDRVSVVVTHLSSILLENAPRLLSREDVRVLTDGVKTINPAAVDELTPALLSLAELQRVLRGLLGEGVAINDLPRIYEALSLRARVSTEAEGLVEAARQALGPAVATGYADDGVLRVITIDPMLEQSMLEGLRPSDQGSQILLDVGRVEFILSSLADTLRAVEERGHRAVVVCAPSLRPAVHRLLASRVKAVVVLSYLEATAADLRIDTVGVIRANEQVNA
jgi:flagellar biosynthesis protein FlhA